ncbi:alpha-1,2-fucosyltransferase [Bacteroides sp.]|uniref:alpha-1,2-fucosyltransferase n=1 Tax=Bacteroides sp. TaxID=29523 RepID=UPI002A806580|nr:alpha-1,2-fucosyltransferase [Bacteroides sp.]
MEIIIRMSAGLANRMFQYSYYLYLSKQGYNVSLDNNYRPTKWAMEDIDWERIFPNAKVKSAEKRKIYLMGGGYDWVSKIRRHYLPFTSRVIMPKTTELVPKEKLLRSIYIAGAFQNAEMVNSIEDSVCEVFRFQNFSDEKNILLAEEMKAVNSVSIHVRKGVDYLTRAVYKGTCPKDYYIKAIDYIEKKVENPVFYVFSDNWDWVEENLSGINYKSVNWNPSIGWGNHLDMQLMSLCKYNIISNSTYSWWGALLNRNEKIVITPKNWFNEKLIEFRDVSKNIILEDWIQI